MTNWIWQSRVLGSYRWCCRAVRANSSLADLAATSNHQSSNLPGPTRRQKTIAPNSAAPSAPRAPRRWLCPSARRAPRTSNAARAAWRPPWEPAAGVPASSGCLVSAPPTQTRTDNSRNKAAELLPDRWNRPANQTPKTPQVWDRNRTPCPGTECPTSTRTTWSAGVRPKRGFAPTTAASSIADIVLSARTVRRPTWSPYWGCTSTGSAIGAVPRPLAFRTHRTEPTVAVPADWECSAQLEECVRDVARIAPRLNFQSATGNPQTGQQLQAQWEELFQVDVVCVAGRRMSIFVQKIPKLLQFGKGCNAHWCHWIHNQSHVQRSAKKIKIKYKIW